jgi:hypothetical protein
METLEEMQSRLTQLEAILENRVIVVDTLFDVCSIRHDILEKESMEVATKDMVEHFWWTRVEPIYKPGSQEEDTRTLFCWKKGKH